MGDSLLGGDRFSWEGPPCRLSCKNPPTSGHGSRKCKPSVCTVAHNTDPYFGLLRVHEVAALCIDGTDVPDPGPNPTVLGCYKIEDSWEASPKELKCSNEARRKFIVSNEYLK